MNSMITPALFTKEISHTVLNNLKVRIKVAHNPYSLPPESLFSLAARNNPKRSYLFVSKLIGKHIPVHPRVPFLTGYLLASRLAEWLGLQTSQTKINTAANMLTCDCYSDFQIPTYHFPGKALFIGFAETATALGHAVFNCFTGDISYKHTTREHLEGACDTIYFTEEHCHAPEQRLLISDTHSVTENDLLVLIDDEITSGNTCLNIIATIQKKYPQKNFIILTILDWRTAEANLKYQTAAQALGVQIEVLSLLKGSFDLEGDSPVINEPLAVSEESIPAVTMVHGEMGDELTGISPGSKGCTYLGCTGRFGVNISDTKQLIIKATDLGGRLSGMRQGGQTLCLGTGEFMYIPFLIASCMGTGVMVQSTTRSPVHPAQRDDYAVKYAITFEDPFRPGIKNYIYNIPPYHYDEVFVFWEREVSPEQVAPLVQALAKAGVKQIIFVSNCRPSS